MALGTTDEEDSKNNPAQTDYNQKVSGLVGAEEKGTVDSTTADSLSEDASSNVRNAENNPQSSWTDNTTASLTRSGLPGFLVTKKRSRGPLIGILLTLLVGGGGAGFFFGPLLAPIAFFENITNDLNDQLSAMDVREGYVFRNKLPATDRKAALTGCTKLSIRCKFATINDKQAARLKASGIEVTPDQGTGIFGKRIKPTSYKFQGVSYSSEEWAKQLKSNPLAQHAQRRANNMKFLGTNDPTFARVLKRFGVSKKPPELTGSAKDRVNALMNTANAANPKDIKFTPVDTNPDGSPKPGTDYTLNGDPTKKLYTADQVASSNKSINRVVSAKPPSKVTKASLGALSVLGYWDLACSIKNMLVGASVAAKVANQAELIKYVMPLASLAGKIRAGDATQEDATALGTFVTQTDVRKYLPDIGGAITSATISQGTQLASNIPNTLNNPNYGKSAMDSSLYTMSSSGGVAAPSITRSQYSLGFGQNSLLAGISGFADIASIIVNLGDASICHWVQNPVARIAGTVVGVVAAVGSFGTSAGVQIGIAAGMMTAMLILDGVVNAALSSTGLTNSTTLGDAPVDRGDAAWTGIAGLLGSSAQTKGLIPGNSAQIAEYQQSQNNTKQQYIAMESETANPLDINNQYSFMGSFTRSLLGYSSTTFSPSSFLGNVASIVSGGMASLVKPYSTYAASIDQSRFKQCDDASYKALGINADVQCNVRYIMPAADLTLDTDAVALWMEDSGNVEKDTTTGFPAGYQPPQPQESQGAVLDFVTGTVSSAITSTVNTRQFGEYGKFLDYCVYRTLPFGETGEEDSAVGDAEHDWKTGKKCMELGGEMSYFRIYTLDKAIQDADDGLTDSTTAFSGSDTPVSYTSDSVTVHPSPLDSYVLPRQVFGVLQSYRSRSVYA